MLAIHGGDVVARDIAPVIGNRADDACAFSRAGWGEFCIRAAAHERRTRMGYLNENPAEAA